MVLTAASPAWNGDYSTAEFVLRLLVAAAAGFFAIIAAESREPAQISGQRVELLAAISEFADGSLPLEEVLASLSGALVPAVGDICVFDSIRGGEVVRRSVRASGPRADEVAAALRARPPGSVEVIESGHPEAARTVGEDFIDTPGATRPTARR